MFISKAVGITGTAGGLGVYAEQKVSWLGLHSPEITAIAGIVSIVCAVAGLGFSIYYKHKSFKASQDNNQ
ncbi:hypothetical protein TYM08_P2989 [Marinicellulosiphila megalodicopiae]